MVTVVTVTERIYGYSCNRVTVTERIYGYSCNRVTVTVCHRVTGSKTAPYYRLPIPKRLFAYTQMRLYANLNGTFLHEQLILNIEKHKRNE